MKPLSNEIRNAQKETYCKPALKIKLQEYVFPTKETHLRYNAFDWTKVWEGNKPMGAKAACAYDGSLIIADSPIIFSGEVTGTTQEVTGFLNDGTEYSWWVCPFYNTYWDVTNISDTWTFTNTTGTGGAGVPFPNNASNCYATDGKITFNWAKIEPAGYTTHQYWLHVTETAACPRITRYTSPSPSTDFTNRGAEDTPSFQPAPRMEPKPYTPQSYMPIACTDFDIAVDPTSAEVVMFWTSNVGASDYNTIKYSVSSDNGANWGAVQSLPWITPDTLAVGIPLELYAPRHIAVSYKDNGDLCVAGTIGQVVWVRGMDYVYSGLDQAVYFKQRIGGTWDTIGGGSCGPFGKPTYGWFGINWILNENNDFLNLFNLHGTYGWPVGGGSYSRAPIFTKSIDLEYDGDWIVSVDYFQNNLSDEPLINRNLRPSLKPLATGESSLGSKQAVFYGIMGDGETYPIKEVHWLGMINLADATSAIDSLKDISHFSASLDFTKFSGLDENLKKRLTGWTGDGKELTRENAHIDITEGSPFSFLHKIADFPLVLSVHDGDVIHFLKKREDTSIAEGVFTNASQLHNPFPLGLCANSEYVFAYNSNQIFISPLPTYWTEPVIGSGAGSYTDVTFSSILKISERALEPHGTKTLDVYLDDYDGTFSNAGDFQTCLDVGSRVSLYEGYYVGSTEYMVENSRYFVDSWEATRRPNLYLYVLHCIDAWGLLNQYVFMRPVRFNMFEHEYTGLELVEMVVGAIGGTLTYGGGNVRGGDDIEIMYPKIEVNAGDNAGNLLRRLLNLSQLEIKFFGNDATLVTTSYLDPATYYLKFPS